jgi:hypothetical protein
MKGKAILVLGILFWSLLQAGLGDYNFSYSVSSWQELSSANNLGDIDTDEENFTNPDYPAGQTVTYGTGLPIGFDFYFDGHVYDRFGVNANGWIGLGKSEYGLRSVDLLSSSYASPLNYINASHPYEDRLARIAGFARDLAAQSGASLSYATLGTAPERVLVVQWKNYRRRTASTESFNFQIQLHESGSEVRIVYGQMQSSGTFTVQVGMRAMPAAEASNFATLNTNDGWTYSTPGSAANTAAVISATNYPIAGACFRWQPPNHAQADFVAYPQSGFAPLSVNFTDQSTAGASPITSWYWTFGDGGTSNAQNPSHIYQTPVPTLSVLQLRMEMQIKRPKPGRIISRRMCLQHPETAIWKWMALMRISPGIRYQPMSMDCPWMQTTITCISTAPQILKLNTISLPPSRIPPQTTSTRA